MRVGIRGPGVPAHPSNHFVPSPPSKPPQEDFEAREIDDESSESAKEPSNDEEETPEENAIDVPIVDELISELCESIGRCDPRFNNVPICINQWMDEGWKNGVVVRQIWDNFGLGESVDGWVPFNEAWVPSKVREGIAEGSIEVNQTALTGCLTELNQACFDGKKLGADIYQVMDNVFFETESCSSVLEISKNQPR